MYVYLKGFIWLDPLSSMSKKNCCFYNLIFKRFGLSSQNGQ